MGYWQQHGEEKVYPSICPTVHPSIHPSIYLLSVETLPLEATNRDRAANETRPSEPTRKNGDGSNVLPMETGDEYRVAKAEATARGYQSMSTTKED